MSMSVFCNRNITGLHNCGDLIVSRFQFTFQNKADLAVFIMRMES